MSAGERGPCRNSMQEFQVLDAVIADAGLGIILRALADRIARVLP